ncbi:MAG: fibronectin type III domain-containing protein [Candidatus Neomarinimicrobiota bacterium]
MIILYGCSERERLNPFDPVNPVTGGAPSGVRIVSDRATVTLSWNPVVVDDLLDYRIFRQSGNSAWVLYDSVAEPTARFSDSAIEYDTTYRYCLQARTSFDLGTVSDTVTIIPGPLNIWIADFYDMAVHRLTYDGRYALGSAQLTSPIAVEYLAAARQAIVADYWNRSLQQLNDSLEIQSEIRLDGNPVALAQDRQTGRFFVLLTGDPGSIVVFSGTGTELQSVNLLDPVSSWHDLAYDPVTNAVWLTAGSDQVLAYRLGDSANPQRRSGIAGVAELEADPVHGGCWVGGDSVLATINADNELSIMRNNFKVYDISVNPVTGDCYYTGYNRETGEWQTGFFSAGAETILLGDEYRHLNGIQVLPGSGQQAFIVNQVYSWKLLRFDNQARLIGEREGVNSRLDYAIE